jgi:Protein of unknown function (DUF2851)
MKEEYLHYLWKLKKIPFLNLQTTKGENLEILHFGIHNHNAGPDFLNASVKIDENIWAGNIEIHIKSSDWKLHKHSQNPSYDNVILHVVMENDAEINYKSGYAIPTLVIKELIDQNEYKRYLHLIENSTWIPCQQQIKNVPEYVLESMKNKVLVERMVEKSEFINQLLLQTNNDWNQTFYVLLFKTFGLKVNQDAFLSIALQTPWKILQHIQNNDLQVTALLFGQAGLLNIDTKDAYYQKLVGEYHFLKTKYDLNPVSSSVVKFSKLRPSGFPTLRIAQFAKLISKSEFLFSKVLELKSIAEIYLLFEVELDSYWDEHYTFEQQSKKTKKKLSKPFIDLIIINAIVPLFFSYDKNRKTSADVSDNLQLLDQLHSEKNNIITNWNELGVKSRNASDSQSLIHLKNKYCDLKKCLNCSVGNYILK